MGCSSVKSCPESAITSNVAPRIPAASAGWLGAEEGVVSAGENQGRGRDAVELASHIVPRAGEGELHHLGARGGLGADEALDPLHLGGVVLAERAREDAIDEARLDVFERLGEAGQERQATTEPRAGELDSAHGRSGEAELRHAPRGEDANPGGDHSAERDPEDMRLLDAEVIEEMEAVARHPLVVVSMGVGLEKPAPR